MKPVLVDTGFLVAAYKKLDQFHPVCADVYEHLDCPLVSCEAVVMETLHLLQATPGAADCILASIGQGALELPFRLSQSAESVRKILEKYSDIPADFADACLVQMADELDTGDILTLDSDFRHYRWRRNRPFRLLIPLE